MNKCSKKQSQLRSWQLMLKNNGEDKKAKEMPIMKRIDSEQIKDKSKTEYT